MKIKICIMAAALVFVFGAVFSSYAEDSRQEAMDLLAEARVERCRICVEKLRAKAFKMLDYVYYPGLEIASTESCVFEKSELENQLVLNCNGETPSNPDYPRVTFLFHTRETHLVGIDPQDYTSDGMAETIRNAPEGARFAGRILIVAYLYGDGDGFNLYPSSNHLQVHCKIENAEVVQE
ncbi:MAG: hypothetical protein JEZ02_09030 [Desulfatibacillum sp.]|nr:hypothetical protein [Desulfatibacillum sp.]